MKFQPLDNPASDRACAQWLRQRNADVDRQLGRKRGGGANGKPITIAGVRYPSIRAAAVALGVYSAKFKAMAGK
jgi:hypothetical protein